MDKRPMTGADLAEVSNTAFMLAAKELIAEYEGSQKEMGDELDMDEECPVVVTQEHFVQAMKTAPSSIDEVQLKNYSINK